MIEILAHRPGLPVGVWTRSEIKNQLLRVFHRLVEEVFTVFFLAVLKTIFSSGSPFFLCTVIGE